MILHDALGSDASPMSTHDTLVASENTRVAQRWTGMADHTTMPICRYFSIFVYFRFNKKDVLFNCKMSLAKHRTDFFFFES